MQYLYVNCQVKHHKQQNTSKLWKLSQTVKTYCLLLVVSAHTYTTYVCVPIHWSITCFFYTFLVAFDSFPSNLHPVTMMCRTCSTSTAYCRTDRRLVSVATTMLAMLPSSWLVSKILPNSSTNMETTDHARKPDKATKSKHLVIKGSYFKKTHQHKKTWDVQQLVCH